MGFGVLEVSCGIFGVVKSNHGFYKKERRVCVCLWWLWYIVWYSTQPRWYLIRFAREFLMKPHLKSIWPPIEALKALFVPTPKISCKKCLSILFTFQNHVPTCHTSGHWLLYVGAAVAAEGGCGGGGSSGSERVRFTKGEFTIPAILHCQHVKVWGSRWTPILATCFVVWSTNSCCRDWTINPLATVNKPLVFNSHRRRASNTAHRPKGLSKFGVFGL